jgi:hypothetical protein
MEIAGEVSGEFVRVRGPIARERHCGSALLHLSLRERSLDRRESG